MFGHNLYFVKFSIVTYFVFLQYYTNSKEYFVHNINSTGLIGSITSSVLWHMLM